MLSTLNKDTERRRKRQALRATSPAQWCTSTRCLDFCALACLCNQHIYLGAYLPVVMLTVSHEKSLALWLSHHHHHHHHPRDGFGDFAEYGASGCWAQRNASRFGFCNLSHSLVSFAGVSASKASSVKVRLFGPLSNLSLSIFNDCNCLFSVIDSCLPFVTLLFHFIYLCLRKK